jgi:hypothetical protein
MFVMQGTGGAARADNVDVIARTGCVSRGGDDIIRLRMTTAAVAVHGWSTALTRVSHVENK